MKWFKIMKKTSLKWLSMLLLFFFILLSSLGINLPVHAQVIQLIPGGETIGIKIDTGIYVVGKFQVETVRGKVSPWKKSDIQNGDQIVQIDGKKIANNRELSSILQTTKEPNVILTIERNHNLFNTAIDVVLSKTNEKTIGIYVKDRLLGVGTLTFIDPRTMRYGALGHGIYDSTIDLGPTNGELLTSTVESIKKGTPGTPGEKRASMKSEVLGTIESNRATGIYGIIKKSVLLNKKAIPIATQHQVKKGRACFLTVIDKGKVESFDLEIIDVNYQENSSIKGIKVKITDNDLVEVTGGIIQGMSGSPIIQDGKIVGAISHVTVENPLIGYGIFLEWMLQDFTNFDTN